MHETRPFVLSIAGIDPSAGAGLLADIKTLEQHKVAGLGVATCITMQNHVSFSGIHWFNFDLVKRQINSLFEAYDIIIAKIGVVPNWEFMNLVVDELIAHQPRIKIIIDPILVASSGYKFCDPPLDVLRDEILRKIYLLTPNQLEFDSLFGTDEETFCHVLLKSFRNAEDGTDILIERNGDLISFEAQSMGTEKHGSGCVLSSSIAANLALGKTLEKSIRDSKRYIEKYLSDNNTLIAHHS